MPGIKGATKSRTSVVEVVDEVEESAEMPNPRDYQKPRVVTTKVLGETFQDEEWAWNRTTLRKFLEDCPKMTVFVPLDPNNDGDDPRTARPMVVRIDGIPIEVPKGRSVRVARPVGEIIVQSQQKYRTSQSLGLDLYTIKADATGEAALGAFQPQMSDADDVPASDWKE